MNKWLYRLEATSPDDGLWYNSRGEYHWGIGETNGETKFLPMGYDERYKKDAKLLISKGFVFTRYLATEYVEYENETTFIKETSLAREVLNIEDIWTSK